ncbi:hypothetical protein D0T49_04315 [Paludibacter sp. 221]|uniref:hypothetical protein n=1 Tax=Paludibacter sp. 221 TaxID=2302939 RepID=UPI0013D82DC5|nr:hypothetical protein [Paludibacter sp. 221]NDV46264.1 hypothetical protein [Paludibacter sp. 221]
MIYEHRELHQEYRELFGDSATANTMLDEHYAVIKKDGSNAEKVSGASLFSQLRELIATGGVTIPHNRTTDKNSQNAYQHWDLSTQNVIRKVSLTEINTAFTSPSSSYESGLYQYYAGDYNNTMVIHRIFDSGRSIVQFKFEDDGKIYVRTNTNGTIVDWYEYVIKSHSDLQGKNDEAEFQHYNSNTQALISLIGESELNNNLTALSGAFLYSVKKTDSEQRFFAIQTTIGNNNYQFKFEADKIYTRNNINWSGDYSWKAYPEVKNSIGSGRNTGVPISNVALATANLGSQTENGTITAPIVVDYFNKSSALLQDGESVLSSNDGQYHYEARPIGIINVPELSFTAVNNFLVIELSTGKKYKCYPDGTSEEITI